MTLAVLTFGEALTRAQATGAKIARKGWNGAGQFVQAAMHARVFLPYPEGGAHATTCVDTGPLMVLRNAQGEYVPWTPSQGDLAAVDWMELP